MVPGASSSDASIFRITPSTGAFEAVINFASSTLGGGFPTGLTLATDGTFYGITIGNPAIVFHFTPSTGSLTTVAVSFPEFDGILPSGPVFGLSFGPNGNIYGLYSVYGENGTGLFEVEPNGSNLQLFPFFINDSDAVPANGLLLASDGNFWATYQYGNGGPGDIITLSPANGTLIQELSAPFSKSSAVGAYPEQLIQLTDGTLLGTTYGYGAASTGHFGDGTVFSLNAGLPPR
jgi:sugar lactone lactonase YvrE